MVFEGSRANSIHSFELFLFEHSLDLPYNDEHFVNERTRHIPSTTQAINMAINWVLPARGAQALLSLTVLGLMSYGKPLLTPTHLPRTIPNTPQSLTMVVHPLAPILPRGSKLPHLRALLDPPRARLPHHHPPKILTQTLIHSREIRVARPRRPDHVILVRRLHCTRSVSER